MLAVCCYVIFTIICKSILMYKPFSCRCASFCNLTSCIQLQHTNTTRCVHKQIKRRKCRKENDKRKRETGRPRASRRLRNWRRPGLQRSANQLEKASRLKHPQPSQDKTTKKEVLKQDTKDGRNRGKTNFGVRANYNACVDLVLPMCTEKGGSNEFKGGDSVCLHCTRMIPWLSCTGSKGLGVCATMRQSMFWDVFALRSNKKQSLKRQGQILTSHAVKYLMLKLCALSEII